MSGEEPAPSSRRERRARGTGPVAPGPPLPRPPTQVVPRRARRRARRRGAWVAVVVLLLVGALVAAVVLLGRDPAPGGTDDAGAAGPTDTLLATLADRGRVTGAALLSVGEEETAALLVPSRLLVDVAGGGRAALAEALSVSDDAPADAVADALDVRVDLGWVLDAAGLAALVDAVGGVVVDVDADVRTAEVSLAAGLRQRLDGRQAAAYATHLAAAEAEAARLARQEEVLTALVAGLPDDVGQVEEVLAAVGPLSRPVGGDTRAVAGLLVRVADHLERDGGYGASVLPVREIATGGDEVLYGLADAEAAEVLAARFAGARRSGTGETVRVLVQNGAGTPGLEDLARERLVEAGFRFVGGGNAAVLGRRTSAVLVPQDTPRLREAGLGVVEALGLPQDVLAAGREAPTTADVIVVLGTDFAEVAAGAGGDS